MYVTTWSEIYRMGVMGVSLSRMLAEGDAAAPAYPPERKPATRNTRGRRADRRRREPVRRARQRRWLPRIASDRLGRDLRCAVTTWDALSESLGRTV